MSYGRTPDIAESPSYYDQLVNMLRNGASYGIGYYFDHYRIDPLGMEIDRLRFAAHGMIRVELRQTINQPEGVDWPVPTESTNVQAQPFSNDVVVDLLALHPALALGMQHEDGFRCVTNKSSWKVIPDSGMVYNMSELHVLEHGPLNEETRLGQLELALGQLPVSATIPERTYLVT